MSTVIERPAKVYNVGEARKHFSSIVELVELGETIGLSRYNHLIGQIVPIENTTNDNLKEEALNRILARSGNHDKKKKDAVTKEQDRKLLLEALEARYV